MARSRVLSFISQWAASSPRNSTAFDQAPSSPVNGTPSPTKPTVSPTADTDGVATTATTTATTTTSNGVPPGSARADRSSLDLDPPPVANDDSRPVSLPGSRPLSMTWAGQPPAIDGGDDTIPELLPIFNHLHSHSNKLYQEGYFLKLNDLDVRGRPSSDRAWTECFAQLVGSVISLWDAAQLDATGEEDNVLPTFINISDASIKMIESLPMDSQDGQTLQNVLSISTAAQNRYLLHFNTLNSLTQWTAGIRLSIFEHSALQEAYTGSLVAGKGKSVNNIRQILERTRMKHEDWARVRFGAGTPWKRYWCVVAPPDEREYQKLQKTFKMHSAYERAPRLITGSLKLYENRKITKKSVPIACLTEAYAAYAIYPQSRPLIDQSTLIKVEGHIAVRDSPEVTTEGFIFIMPESHAAISGFEIMLRFLFPIFDTFGLYGRPNRLVADVLDPRSLMFAMPKDRGYGYLDVLDVANLIHSDGSDIWSERSWRKKMKELTAKRMIALKTKQYGRSSRNSVNPKTMSRASLPATSGHVQFGQSGIIRSTPPTRRSSPSRDEHRDPHSYGPNGSLAPDALRHQRSISEPHVQSSPAGRSPSGRSGENGQDGFETPPESTQYHAGHERHLSFNDNSAPVSPLPSRRMSIEADDATPAGPTVTDRAQADEDMHHLGSIRTDNVPVAPVAPPPSFIHSPHGKPASQPFQAAELRRANTNVDSVTITELAESRKSSMKEQSFAAAWKLGRSGSDASAGRRRSDQDLQERFYSGQNKDRQRLSTIPASPFVDSSEVFPTQTIGLQQAPPVPMHANVSPRSHYFETPSPPVMAPSPAGSGSELEQEQETYASPDANGSLIAPTALIPRMPDEGVQADRTERHSISRKPVPPHSSSALAGKDEPSISPAPSYGSLREHYIDETALNQMGTAEMERSDSMGGSSSSRYHSLSTSPERPHILEATLSSRDVDNLEGYAGDGIISSSPDRARSSHPAVEFGINETRQRPSTSGAISGPRQSYGLEGPVPPFAYDRSVSPLAMDSKRFSTVDGLGNGPVPDRREARTKSWHPGMFATGNGIGPEAGQEGAGAAEWVRQRAAAAAAMRPFNVHANARASSRADGSGSAALAVRKSRSGDWLAGLRSSLPARPRSEAMLGLPRPGPGTFNAEPARELDYASALPPPSQNQRHALSNSLQQHRRQQQQQQQHQYQQRVSAREQEHVARATGTPYFNLSGAGNNSSKNKGQVQVPGHQQPALRLQQQQQQQQQQQEKDRPTAGVVGAIAAREREKEMIKDGRRSLMVQQAIAAKLQRQQREHASQQQQQTQMRAREEVIQQQAMTRAQQQYQQLMKAQHRAGAGLPNGMANHRASYHANGPLPALSPVLHSTSTPAGQSRHERHGSS